MGSNWNNCNESIDTKSITNNSKSTNSSSSSQQKRNWNTSNFYYGTIVAIVILVLIGIELLLPPPQHKYQQYDLQDYMSKSFEYKPSGLIYKSDGALSFLYKYEMERKNNDNIRDIGTTTES